MRRSDDASRGRTPSPLDDGTRSYAVRLAARRARGRDRGRDVEPAVIGDVVVSERYVVLLRTAAPLGGRCPACDGVMDATGCRIGDHRRVDRAAPRRTGLAQIVAARNLTLAALFFDRGNAPRAHTIVATYDYTDERGTLLYQNVRYEPKDFRMRRPDGTGWTWNVKGVRRVLYRLPDLAEARR